MIRAATAGICKAPRADIVRLMRGCELEQALEILRLHNSTREVSVRWANGWFVSITDRAGRTSEGHAWTSAAVALMRAARAWRDAEARR